MSTRYAWSSDGELFDDWGEFDTREEALAWGRVVDSECDIWTAKVRIVSPEEIFPDFYGSDILYKAGERLGEIATLHEDPFNSTDAQDADLNAMFLAAFASWVAKHNLKVASWQAVEIVKHKALPVAS